jgi:choline dehydrogenase-like flavoprotein
MSSANRSKSQVDVLIVGAGPAGLMCATALERAGVRIRIIDKRPKQVTIGHADALMPRSLEVMHVRMCSVSDADCLIMLLQSYGLLDDLMRHGSHMTMAVCDSSQLGEATSNEAHNQSLYKQNDHGAIEASEIICSALIPHMHAEFVS